MDTNELPTYYSLCFHKAYRVKQVHELMNYCSLIDDTMYLSDKMNCRTCMHKLCRGALLNLLPDQRNLPVTHQHSVAGRFMVKVMLSADA